MGKIVVLATGGTIAGEAASAADAVGYQAAQRPVEALLAAARVLGDGRQVLEAQQLAQIDSKDMGMAVWQQLAQACADALARGDVRAVVITHGTDTLEETAYFLQRVLAAAPGGWQAQGKTGMAYPRKADGNFDYARPWGWYVGWARRDDRTVVFARLLQDEKKQEPRTSLRARDGILKELPGILATD